MPKASVQYPSTVVNRNGNGGWHRKGKRAYRNAVLTILQFLQTAKEPRLYHLCFEGKTHKKQMTMLKALVQMADRAGINCEWFAARETADRTKVDHLHVFMVIDAYRIKVAKVFNQFDDGQVAQLCTKHGVNFSIFSPKDDLGIHGNNTYMALPYQGPGNRQTPLGTKRLNDALTWLTYNYKARSKPLEEEADGQIFPASRPTRKKSNPLPSFAALPAAKEGVTTQTESKESNEASITAQYEADSGSEGIAAGESIRITPSSATSTAMVGTGCEILDPSTGTSSTEAEDQWRRGIGRADTHHPEGRLTELIGRIPLPVHRSPREGGSSQVGSYEPPRKHTNSSVQKILYKTSELVHNSHTIF